MEEEALLDKAWVVEGDEALPYEALVVERETLPDKAWVVDKREALPDEAYVLERREDLQNKA